ncbi:hypothetical protein [Streptomyces sp. NPDC055134]
MASGRATAPDPLTTEDLADLFLNGAFVSVAEARQSTSGSEAYVPAQMDP